MKIGTKSLINCKIYIKKKKMQDISIIQRRGSSVFVYNPPEAMISCEEFRKIYKLHCGLIVLGAFWERFICLQTGVRVSVQLNKEAYL